MTLGEILKSAGEAIRRGFARNFERRESSTGRPWPPRKDRKKHPPLRLTGAMYSAATIEGAPGNVTEQASESIAVGVNAGAFRGGYPAVHQFGGGHVPQREFLYIGADALADVDDIVAAGVGELLGNRMIGGRRAG